MIEQLLPAAAASAEAFGDLPGALPGAALFPEEERVVAKAVDKRRREFTTARACARAALGKLGLPPAPILSGPGGAPQWPAGVLGSITHCDGYRACAVAWDSDLLALGLDAEPNHPLPAGVLDVVTVPDERAGLRELSSAAPSVCWDRLLFSAKESVYKAWFPLTERWLGFDQAVVTVQPAASTFSARLLVPGPVRDGRRLSSFAGAWLTQNGLLVTAVAVPAVPARDRSSLSPDVLPRRAAGK